MPTLAPVPCPPWPTCAGAAGAADDGHPGGSQVLAAHQLGRLPVRRRAVWQGAWRRQEGLLALPPCTAGWRELPPCLSPRCHKLVACRPACLLPCRPRWACWPGSSTGACASCTAWRWRVGGGRGEGCRCLAGSRAACRVAVTNGGHHAALQLLALPAPPTYSLLLQWPTCCSPSRCSGGPPRWSTSPPPPSRPGWRTRRRERPGWCAHDCTCCGACARTWHGRNHKPPGSPMRCLPACAAGCWPCSVQPAAPVQPPPLRPLLPRAAGGVLRALEPPLHPSGAGGG